MSSLLGRLFRREGESKTEAREREERLMSAASESKYDQPPPTRRQRLDEEGHSAAGSARESEEALLDRGHGTHDTDVVNADDLLLVQLRTAYDAFLAHVRASGVPHELFVPSVEGFIGSAHQTFSDILQRLKPMLKRALEERLRVNREHNKRLQATLNKDALTYLKNTRPEPIQPVTVAYLINLHGAPIRDPQRETVGRVVEMLKAWKSPPDVARPHIQALLEAYATFCDAVADKRTQAQLLSLIPPNSLDRGQIFKTIYWSNPCAHPWIKELTAERRERVFKLCRWATAEFFQKVLALTMHDLPDSIDLQLLEYERFARDRLVDKAFRDALPVLYEHTRQATLAGIKQLRLQDTIDAVTSYSRRCVRVIHDGWNDGIRRGAKERAHQVRSIVRAVATQIEDQEPDQQEWAAYRKNPSTLLDCISTDMRQEVLPSKDAVVLAIDLIAQLAQHEDQVPPPPDLGHWPTLLLREFPSVQPETFWTHVATAWTRCDAFRAEVDCVHERVAACLDRDVRLHARRIVEQELREHKTPDSFVASIRAKSEAVSVTIPDTLCLEPILHALLGTPGQAAIDDAVQQVVQSFMCLREDPMWSVLALRDLAQTADRLKPYRDLDTLTRRLPEFKSPTLYRHPTH
jgi:hypothetical protein